MFDLALSAACTVGADPQYHAGDLPEPIDDDDSSSSGDAVDASAGESSSSADAPCTTDAPHEDGECSPDDPCAGHGGIGRSYMDTCGVVGSTAFSIGVTCEESLASCLLNESQGAPVHCEWNDVVIHRSAEDPEVCDAQYGPAELCGTMPCFDPCVDAGDELGFAVPYLDCSEGFDAYLFGFSIEPQTCADAVASCTLLQQEVGDYESFICLWNDEVVLWHEATPGACAELGPAPAACDDAEG